MIKAGYIISMAVAIAISIVIVTLGISAALIVLCWINGVCV